MRILFTTIGILVFGLVFGQTQTENYVKNTVYQVETSNGNVGGDGKVETVNYYDGLGRMKQQIIVDGALPSNSLSGGNSTASFTNDLAGFTVDWEIGEGSTSHFQAYGDTNESRRVQGTTPSDDTGILWECVNNAGSGKSDGGFYSSYFPVDKSSSYIFTLWVKKEVNRTDGGIYLGTLNVSSLSGTPNGNPYFIPNRDLPELNEWYLLVGVVHPYNYTGGDSGVSGIYDREGNRIYDGTEWKWRSTTTQTKMRALQYNAVDTSTRQYFWNPIVQKMNTISNGFTMDWNEGVGSTPFFNKNGDIQENKRVYGTAPSGGTELLWQCDNDAANNADGGWNTDYFSISKTNKYRYTTWVKRTGGTSGRAYHGTQAVDDLNGQAVGNPYFWNGILPKLNTWYLMVGIIHPYDYMGNDTGESGVYDMQGNKVLDGKEFKWKSTSTQTRLRNYLYYSTDVNVAQYFWSPKFEVVTSNLEDYIDKATGGDIVTHFEYDELGRSTRSYLPYASSGSLGGSIHTDAHRNTFDFYSTLKYQNTPNPYSETRFEQSPLSRPLEQGAPGASWQISVASDNDHTVKFDYATNTESNGSSYDNVYHYRVNFAGGNTAAPILSTGIRYDAGELYKSIIKDENWKVSSGKNHTTEEFTNKQGQVILKRNFNNDIRHDTYYVYDDFGNLTFVLPPKVSSSDGNVSVFELNELCYQYKYDHRNRLIEKKVPGKGWEYIVYNKLDQPVLTQDTELDQAQKWLFTKYDAFGRVAYTGKISHAGTRAALQAAAESNNYQSQYVTKTSSSSTVGGIAVNYTNNTIPTAVEKVYTLNYYDNYNNFNLGFSKPSTNHFGIDLVDGLQTKGLPTASRVYVLASSNKYINTLMGYDGKARLVWQRTQNTYLDTSDEMHYSLDFTGKIIESRSVHKKGSNPEIVTTDYFTYDRLSRLISHKQRIDDGSGSGDVVLISYNNYDSLGQLESKSVGGQTNLDLEISAVQGLQNVDYRYNVRGWLTDINDVDQLNTGASDLFNFRINYVDLDGQTNTPLYNGNISQTTWKSLGQDKRKRSYIYNYDDLNRLKNSSSYRNQLHSDSSPTGIADLFDLRGINYDKNGNILALQRFGSHNGQNTEMDRLSYSYSGNKLTRVRELSTSLIKNEGFKDGNPGTSTDYLYDDNGNMTRDLNKGISSITYNHLNLPTSVSVTTNEGAGTGTISYVYDATGVKQRKTVSGVSTDYAGSYIYKNNQLQMISQPEGYVEPDGSGGFKYAYNYLDHLGTVRLTYSDLDGDGSIDPASEILKERHTYPFGLEHRGYNSSVVGTENNFQTYLGQEMNPELGLNWLTFRYRNYMPELGRFFGSDPIAEEYFSISNYQFAHNSPVWKIELEGLEGEPTNDVPETVNHEPVKMVSKTKGSNNAFIYGGLVETKIAQETTKKVVEKSVGQRLLGFGSKALGLTFGLILTDFASPNVPTSEIPFDEQIKRFQIDEKLKVDDRQLRAEGDNDSPIKRFNEKLDGLKESSKESDDTKGKSTIFERDGDFGSANELFDSLSPESVKEFLGGRSGVLPDGSTISVRAGSSDGRSTVQITTTSENGRKSHIKFRFNPQE